MMVGSDCSRILRLSRLTNTAATRVRSSARPVSFSTIEASVTSSCGDFSGRSGSRCAQISCSVLLSSLLHALDDLLARRAAGELVGLRQQRALARDLLDRAGERVAVLQPRHDLLGGQSLRDGDRMLHHLAFDQRADHVGDARMRREFVFAVLEIAARLERNHAADEHVRLVDHALAHQQIGDVLGAEPARNVDDLVLRQRSRAPRSAGGRRTSVVPIATATRMRKVKKALPAITSGCRARFERRPGGGTSPAVAPRAGCAATAFARRHSARADAEERRLAIRSRASPL